MIASILQKEEKRLIYVLDSNCIITGSLSKRKNIVFLFQNCHIYYNTFIIEINKVHSYQSRFQFQSVHQKEKPTFFQISPPLKQLI